MTINNEALKSVKLTASIHSIAGKGVFSETEFPVYGILGNPICATTHSSKPYM
jgi:hypothetical protein